MYDKIFARSFSRYEQKKLGYGAFVCSLILALTFCTVFKPYFGPLPPLNLRLSMGVGLRMLTIEDPSMSLSLGMASVEPHTSTNSNPSEKPGEPNVEMNTSAPSNKSEKTVQVTVEAQSPSQPNPPQKTGHIEGEVDPPNAPKKSEIGMKLVTKPICSTAEPRSDFCEMNGDIRVHGISSTIFLASSQVENNTTWRIKPYARKGDETALKHVNSFTIKPSLMVVNKIPQCTENHSVPAIIFSLGGYTGNHFHDFTDVIIPLFSTSREFKGEVKFLITNKKAFWIAKFREILDKLSNYEILDIDGEENIHCFPRIIIGLKRIGNKELSLNPSKTPNGYAMKDFRDFIRSAYSLKRESAIKIKEGGNSKKPRLLIISRRNSRAFMNKGNIYKMAKRLGYNVLIAEADNKSNLSSFAQTVNSCDVMMGVHGAGLTNMVFLPENAVLIQVVPLQLEWLSKYDFGEPSVDMNVRYLEYRIKEEESSLIQQYPDEIRDPISVKRKGWFAFRDLYLDRQNVMLNVIRFRPTLVKAVELLHE